jgi:S1-C subfamily serine protease
MFMKILLLLTALLALSEAHAQNIEKQLEGTAERSEFAVLPVWYNTNSPNITMNVVGTAFLVSPDGYFITAAHVLEKYEPKSAQMTVGIRQRSGDIAGAWFEVIEKDETHDLALCKTNSPLRNFRIDKANPGTEQPIATLHISTSQPVTGQFIAIAGFPLGSWNPAIQLGTVAAIRTTNPNAGRVPAGQRELLQISAAGNKGNSGSPVIALDTDDVIGVIVQAQPAPLFSAPQIQGVPLAQSSGIMAVPAVWVNELLNRHGVKSIAQNPPKGHTSYHALPSK